MSTVSASSYDMSTNPLKRKRGRPRKEEMLGSESNRRAIRSPSSNAGLVGQEVSGFFVGAFDAGYLLTVQVGNSGPIMNGLVFDPQLVVPISSENDIAPHLPMLARNGSPPPVEEDFLNRGAGSSHDDMAEKENKEVHVREATTETVGPTKMMIPQVKNDDTPPSSGVSGIFKPCCNRSAAPMATSAEDSKDVPADIPKKTSLVNVSNVPDASEGTLYTSSEPVSIPTSTGGSPVRIAPSLVSRDETSPEADFEVRRVVEHQIEETDGVVGECFSSEKSGEPSEGLKVDDLQVDYITISEKPVGAKPDIFVEEKLEDGNTV